MSTLTLAHTLSGIHMSELPELFPQFTERDERAVYGGNGSENGNGASVSNTHPVQLDDSAEAFDMALKNLMTPASKLMDQAVKRINELTGRDK